MWTSRKWWYPPSCVLSGRTRMTDSRSHHVRYSGARMPRRSEPFREARMSRLVTSIASTPALRLHLPDRRRFALFGGDFAVIIVVMALYFLARGQAPTRVDESVGLTLRLIGLEKLLHVFVEPSLQHVSIEHHWMQETANYVYAYLHFPVMAAVGVWLWWRGRERFLFMRNVLFVSMGIGVAFYYLLPAAPPRLMALSGHDFGFVDTVFGGNTSVNYAHPSLIRNDYAAIPSFHFGWIALSAAAVWINTRNLVARGLAVTLVVVMAWAIVASANHLFIDMALGGLVVLASWRIARLLTGRSSVLVDAPLVPEPAYAVAQVTTSSGGRRVA